MTRKEHSKEQRKELCVKKVDHRGATAPNKIINLEAVAEL